MMSKFSGLEVQVEETRRLVLLNPTTGQPLRNKATGEDAWIDLLPTDSEVSRKHERAVLTRLIQRQVKKLKAEELEAETTDLLAKLTKAWSLVTISGAPLDVPCTEENARELYSMASLAWLRRQVNDFTADLGNWTPSSSTN
jgi:hypothetical protein